MSCHSVYDIWFILQSIYLFYFLAQSYNISENDSHMVASGIVIREYALDLHENANRIVVAVYLLLLCVTIYIMHYGLYSLNLLLLECLVKKVLP